MIKTTRLTLSRTAVSISWLFIMKPPSPHTAMTRRWGWSMAAMMAEGSPAPHGGQGVVEQQRVRHTGPIVSRKPDLVHAIVEREDTVRRHDFTDIVHQSLRCEAIFGRARREACEYALAQRKQRARVWDLALDAIRQQPK